MLCPYCLREHSTAELLTSTVRFSNGTVHIKATCPQTKQFLKWLPQSAPDQPKPIYFGKYKGRTYQEIAQEDPDYLRWLASVTDKDNIRQACEEALNAD